MNFPRLIRRSISCAALGALSFALGGGCGSSDAGGAPQATDGGTGVDATTPSDSGPGTDSSFDANACQPGDISDFKPVWKTPTAFHQGACPWNPNGEDPTPLWVQFRTACLGASASKTECAKFTDPKAGSADDYKCGQCIATVDTMDHYGPLIVHTGWVELNVAGCLSNAMNDPSGVKCAASVQAVRECEIAACGANCPVSSETTLTLFDGCTQTADDTLCKSYVSAAACIDQVPDAGEVAKCVESKPFDQRFDDIVELFCGGSPSIDAGGGPD